MKKTNFKSLKLKQLSRAITEKKPIPIEKIGQQLKNLREALGMNQRQLAKKLKISQSAVSQIEENTQASKLKTIVKLAKALECDFMGIIVSDEPLEAIVKKQAEKAARRSLDRAYSNMAMEKQSPSGKTYREQIKKLIEELTSNPGPELWEG